MTAALRLRCIAASTWAHACCVCGTTGGWVALASSCDQSPCALTIPLRRQRVLLDLSTTPCDSIKDKPPQRLSGFYKLGMALVLHGSGRAFASRGFRLIGPMPSTKHIFIEEATPADSLQRISPATRTTKIGNSTTLDHERCDRHCDCEASARRLTMQRTARLLES